MGATLSAINTSMHNKFGLAYRQGPLNKPPGADTEFAEALLSGEYSFPKECEEATNANLQEITLIFSRQQSPIAIHIEPRDFHWWRTSKKTKSSRSLISFILIAFPMSFFENIIFNNQLKSALNRMIACSLSISMLLLSFSRRTSIPCSHLFKGKPMQNIKLSFFTYRSVRVLLWD